LLISHSVTTIADAFLHKGKVWGDDQLSALRRNTREKQTSQEKSKCIRLKFPQSPSLQQNLLTMLHYAWTWNANCFYELEM